MARNPYKIADLRWPLTEDQIKSINDTFEDVYRWMRNSITSLRDLVLTGDVTGSVVDGEIATTLASVNSNVGAFGDSTHIPTVTVDAKGRVTAASQTAVVAGQSSAQILTRVYIRG